MLVLMERSIDFQRESLWILIVNERIVEQFAAICILRLGRVSRSRTSAFILFIYLFVYFEHQVTIKKEKEKR